MKFQFRFLVFIIIILPMIISLSGCDKGRVYDDNIALEGNNWLFKQKQFFNVEIADTSSLHNILLNLRINGNYKYSNLFVLFKITTPKGEEDVQQLEFKLASEDGEWLGSGLGDIYSYRIPIVEKIKFPVAGEYKFSIQQNMRDDQLEDVEDVGLRIERAEP